MIDTFIVLDVETTGLDYANDRIIEFGIAVFQKRECTWTEGGYIQSDVPNKAQHINNINPELIANAETQEEVMRCIARWLRMAVSSKLPVMAFNAAFDLSFIAYSFARCGIPFDFKELRVLDPLVIHRHYAKTPWPYAHGARKLAKMQVRYGTLTVPDHTAQSDAVATGELYIELNYHYPFGSYSALQLHRMQSQWAEEWADGLELLIHSYDPDKPVRRTRWPVECPSPQDSNEELSRQFSSYVQRYSEPPCWVDS
jgi:DNA polymerase III subunit epsilon